MNTRQIFAALANSDTRDMYARVILGQAPESPTSKQSRALLNLHRAGLIDTADGTWSPTAVFRELLAEGARDTPKGYERFLENGRVARWPSKAADKDGLIRWINVWQLTSASKNESSMTGLRSSAMIRP